MGLLRTPGNFIWAMGVLKLSHMDSWGIFNLFGYICGVDREPLLWVAKPTGQKSSIMRTHKSDGGSQWKDEITMPDHVGQELALSETCSSYRHPCKTDSYMQIQLQQVFERLFTSSTIVFSAMRLRCEIAHLLGHVSHADRQSLYGWRRYNKRLVLHCETIKGERRRLP